MKLLGSFIFKINSDKITNNQDTTNGGQIRAALTPEACTTSQFLKGILKLPSLHFLTCQTEKMMPPPKVVVRIK